MPQESLLLVGLFFVAATLYSSVGHAGASGYLAAMAFAGVATAAMRPTALVLNVLVATLATVRYARAGHFQWRTFWPFALSSVPMAFVGGAIKLPGSTYRTVVGAVLVLAAIRLVATARRTAEDEAGARSPPVVPALMWGAVIGVVSGLTGTGGGIFLSPVLLFLGWAGTRTASGVSAAFILVNSIAGIAAAPESLRLLPADVPIWCVAALVGGWLGTEMGTRRLAPAVLRVVLGVVLFVAAGKLIFS